MRARAALRWRPKFLAALAIGRTMVFACKTASVAYNIAKYHRAQDRQFDEQCLAATDYAGELLESRAFQRALEGDVEPIVYLGVIVGTSVSSIQNYRSNCSGHIGLTSVQDGWNKREHRHKGRCVRSHGRTTPRANPDQSRADLGFPNPTGRV